MREKLRQTSYVIAAICLMGSVGVGQVERNRIDQLANPYIESETAVGFTVGVIAKGQRQAFGYGKVGSEIDRQPDADTVYEIGSVSKVFTGLLLADAVVREQVKLDQPLQTLLPVDVQLEVKDQPILLRHLSTHTSGLPRLPSNMRPANPNNPYADYSVDQLHKFLHEYRPPRAPEEKPAYSNLGAGLLGHFLAQDADMSYEQLLSERITGPLVMPSTALELAPPMKQKLSPPHLADGSPGHNWDFIALAGAGGIRSSVNDMLSFIAAQLDPPDGQLGEAINLAWQKHYEPEDPQQFDMGLGWHVAHDGQTRWHNGQTGGYHSMVLVNRALQVGVVILCNTGTGEMDVLGEDLIRMLAGMPVEPRVFEEIPEVEVSGDLLQRYVGKYLLAPGVELTVTTKDDQLNVQLTGQPSFRVFPKSETEWFYKIVDAQLTFAVDKGGKCNMVTLHQNGRDMPAKRIED